MAIAHTRLEKIINDAFPDAVIQLDDMLGDQDHYGLTIISETFEGLSRVQRHQKIYQALGPLMGGELHALSIRAKTPAETPVEGTGDASVESPVNQEAPKA